MRARWLLPAIAFGCARAASTDPSVASDTSREIGETAVGARLENPAPYASALEKCSLSGPVSKDLVATGVGVIEARCDRGVSLRWSVVRATAMQVDGPATIRLSGAGLNYLYTARLLADGKRVGGHPDVEWTTAADCEDRIVLHGFNGATFAIPRSVGTCTLEARGPFDLRAAFSIVVE